MNVLQVVAVLSAITFSLLADTGLAASQGGPNIGDAPPLLRATALLQAPPGASFDQDFLRGKVIVLEFWASWCGPCVASISHLNELARQFEGKPVQFIAITAETADTVAPFLQKRAMNAWVALDTNRAMNRAYGITGIPHTVVLDTNGMIAAITYPANLTGQAIQDLLDGRKISLPVERSERESSPTSEKPQAAPLFELAIWPSHETNSASWGGGGRFSARASLIRDLLPRAFDQQENGQTRMINQALLPEGRFDLTIIQTKNQESDVNALEANVAPLMQQLLSSAFGLHGRKETIETNVWLLNVRRTNAPGLVISPTSGFSCRTGCDTIEGTCISMSLVAHAIESASGRPVFDETGLTNYYDLSLKWEHSDADPTNLDSMRQVLAERCGLELVAARRPVEMVVVDGPKTQAADGGKSAQPDNTIKE